MQSNCMYRTCPLSIRSRQAPRVVWFSPEAIGIVVAAASTPVSASQSRSGAPAPRLRPGGRGSSSQVRSKGSKALALAMACSVSQAWLASAMICTCGPTASRTACTRAPPLGGPPRPMRILTARNPRSWISSTASGHLRDRLPLHIEAGGAVGGDQVRDAAQEAADGEARRPWP